MPRKRKKGARTKSGRLSQSKGAILARGERDVVLAQPHRRWLPEDKRTDQLAATVLGRLHLAKAITEEEYWAGERYGKLRRQFARVMASPVTTKSAGFSYVAERVEVPDGEYEMADAVRETDEEMRDRVVDAMNAVTNALGWMNAHGPVSRELNAVCYLDQQPANMAALRAGIDALVRLWRIRAPEDASGVRAFRTERPAWDDSSDLVVVER